MKPFQKFAYITIVWDVNHQTDACTDTLSDRCTKYTNEKKKLEVNLLTMSWVLALAMALQGLQNH
jgi:hypothetical protein